MVSYRRVRPDFRRRPKTPKTRAPARENEFRLRLIIAFS